MFCVRGSLVYFDVEGTAHCQGLLCAQLRYIQDTVHHIFLPEAKERARVFPMRYALPVRGYHRLPKYLRKPVALVHKKEQRCGNHRNKEAEKGTGQATTTGDEQGDQNGTQRRRSEADGDWCPKGRKSNEIDGLHMDSSSTTHSSSGETSSTSSVFGSESGNSENIAKVVITTKYERCTKRPPSNSTGRQASKK